MPETRVNQQMEFPSSSSVPVLVVILCLRANGNSSYRDAMNITKASRRVWGTSRCRTVCVTDRMHSLLLRPGPGKPDTLVNPPNANDACEAISKTVQRYSSTHNVLFVISAHGYASGNHEHVRFGGRPMTDTMLRAAVFNRMHPDCTALCLTDTCHSGSMLDLPWRSVDGKVATLFHMGDDMLSKSMRAVSVSACRERELAGEDVSDAGGWGGKLVCQFLDWLHEHNGVIHVLLFYSHVAQVFSTQNSQRSHPVLSCTQPCVVGLEVS